MIGKIALLFAVVAYVQVRIQTF